MRKKYGRSRRRSSYRRTNTRRGGYSGRYSGNAAEKKFVDWAFRSNTNENRISNTGTVFKFNGIKPGGTAGDNVNVSSLVAISEGGKQNQMIGRKVTVKGIYFRFTYCRLDVVGAATNSAGSVPFRMMLVMDRQANGATASFDDVYAKNGNGNLNIYSFRDLERSSRFKIIKEWKLNAVGFVTGDGSTVEIAQKDYYKTWGKKCSIPITYSPQADAAVRAENEITTNNLLVMAVALTDAAVDITGHVRIRYTDK
jgi:hypothetical protein